ncbi:MAG: hypothetical protein F6K47_03515 [Symploca sp. SIO2E6]|nr:hypothetical protein [Symploca sp. SIO2E6]
MMDGCIFDVANTGDASFAESAANGLTDVIKDRVEQEIRDSASAAASRSHSCSRWYQNPRLAVLEGKNNLKLPKRSPTFSKSRASG